MSECPNCKLPGGYIHIGAGTMRCGRCGYMENEELLEALGLLIEMTDPDPCSYDHHGYCQAHSLHLKPCPHERAKQFINDHRWAMP